MRPATLILMLLLSASPIHPADASEPQWHRVPTAPYELNNKQDALAFGSQMVGFYGNGTGRIYRTDDAGSHWRLVWHHPGTYVRALDMVDADLGFMGNVGTGYFDDVTDTRSLFVTRDGGQTWMGRDMSAVTGMILDIHFIDAQTGFIAGASASDEGKARARILQSTDGGETWRAEFDSPTGRRQQLEARVPERAGRLCHDHELRCPAERSPRLRGQDRGWRRALAQARRDDGPRLDPVRHRLPRRAARLGRGRHGRLRDDRWRRELAPGAMGLSTNKIRFLPRPDGGTRALVIGHDLFVLDMPPAAK